MLSPVLREKVLMAQKNEINEHLVYQKLAGIVKNKDHARILEQISNEERGHYDFFKNLSGIDVSPDSFKVHYYVFLARMFGLNFGLRYMENGEQYAQDFYHQLKAAEPGIDNIIANEKQHEEAILDLIDEENLKYVSSMVLGLNDALVELTAALAGFTLAIQNARLIGILGLITGLAASMSMAASEYLSTKEEASEKNPMKASVYTGMAYVGTVILLVIPFFLFTNILACLGAALLTAMVIIFIFTFYISVAKKLNFRKRFVEMAGLSLSISAITFFIGMAIRNIFGIDI